MPNPSPLYLIANSPTQVVQALIFAKKIAQLASQQGINSQVFNDINEFEQFLTSNTLQKNARVVWLENVATGLQNALANSHQQVVPLGLINQPQAALDHILAEKYTLNVNTGISSDKVLNATALNTNPMVDNKPLRFVAITACPTGVAHTFMAADALKLGAQRHGYHIEVETQGSVGAKNILTPEAIAAADVVILATDIEVNTDRFVGKKVYRCSTGFALKQTDKAFSEAVQQAAVFGGHGTTNVTDNAANAVTTKRDKLGFYKHLMTGVSFMLPIVVAGGLLIAMSFVFGIDAFKQSGSLAEVLMQTGKAAFTLMIPILSGYIAYSIADRAGLAAGLIGGLLSAQLGAGFLGAIVSGFLAGYISLVLARKLKLPQTMEALKPILIIPLISSLLIGLLMFYVVGQPVAFLLKSMETFLVTMGTGNTILLGVVLGAMMCVDMGGPINKAAYTFSVGLLTLATPNQFPIAAAMAGGMVPAIGMGLATLLGKAKFSLEERNAGKAAFVLGLCFISEGAIPFAAKDPARVIPSCILGGAITGGLVGLFHTTVAAPHGGIFVLLIPNAINKPLMYLVAIAVGSVITGLLYAVLRRRPVVALGTQSLTVPLS